MSHTNNIIQLRAYGNEYPLLSPSYTAQHLAQHFLKILNLFILLTCCAAVSATLKNSSMVAMGYPACCALRPPLKRGERNTRKQQAETITCAATPKRNTNATANKKTQQIQQSFFPIRNTQRNKSRNRELLQKNQRCTPGDKFSLHPHPGGQGSLSQYGAGVEIIYMPPVLWGRIGPILSPRVRGALSQ